MAGFPKLPDGYYSKPHRNVSVSLNAAEAAIVIMMFDFFESQIKSDTITDDLKSKFQFIVDLVGEKGRFPRLNEPDNI